MNYNAKDAGQSISGLSRSLGRSAKSLSDFNAAGGSLESMLRGMRGFGSASSMVARMEAAMGGYSKNLHASAIAQTRLARETADAARAQIKAVQAVTNAGRAEYAKQKRDIDARAKYKFSAGLSTKNACIQFLRDEEAAETKSYQRWASLLRQRQQLEAKSRGSVLNELAGGALAGVSA